MFTALGYLNKFEATSREEALDMVKNNMSLIFLPEEFKSDKEVVLEAVKRNGRALEYASEELSADKEVVLEAVKSGYALRHVSKELKGDKEVVLEAVKQDGYALEYASKELRGDKEVVLEAVKQDGPALRDASEELSADKEVVLEAVKQDGYALGFASKELKNDKEVVLEAVKQNGRALRDASEELSADKEVVLEAVKQGGYALRYASEELSADKEVVLEAVKQGGYALEFASEEFKSDKEVVLEAVKQNGFTLKHASEEFKADKEVVLEAVKQNGLALEYASAELREVLPTLPTASIDKVLGFFKGYPDLLIEFLKEDYKMPYNPDRVVEYLKGLKDLEDFEESQSLDLSKAPASVFNPDRKKREGKPGIKKEIKEEVERKKTEEEEEEPGIKEENPEDFEKEFLLTTKIVLEDSGFKVSHAKEYSNGGIISFSNGRGVRGIYSKQKTFVIFGHKGLRDKILEFKLNNDQIDYKIIDSLVNLLKKLNKYYNRGTEVQDLEAWLEELVPSYSRTNFKVKDDRFSYKQISYWPSGEFELDSEMIDYLEHGFYSGRRLQVAKRMTLRQGMIYLATRR